MKIPKIGSTYYEAHFSRADDYSQVHFRKHKVVSVHEDDQEVYFSHGKYLGNTQAVSYTYFLSYSRTKKGAVKKYKRSILREVDEYTNKLYYTTKRLMAIEEWENTF